MGSHQDELHRLSELIREWNANRLDLFEISVPDETLEFHGVMRFFFQDEGAKLATKCIRVGSNQGTGEVIDTLVEKFRPNMKMLDMPTYNLYEINSNGDERLLNRADCPLRIQLGWGKDDREGRFLLRNANSKPTKMADLYENKEEMQPFKRKLSKREKKELKKQQQHERAAGKENASATGKDDQAPSFFVRTKSNSEAVMKRRQELKIKKKLDEMKREGDQGGMLKIHGEALNPDVPYKALLLSVNDTALFVVKEMLDKYGLSESDSRDYCLVQKFNAGEYSGGSRAQEILVEDEECPLAILQSQVTRGNITFHVRKRDGRRSNMADDTCPYLLELNLDGSDLKQAKKHLLPLSNVTEVGSQPSPSSGQHLRLIGPTIFPSHAVIAHTEGVVTVTPAARNEAEIRVEGERIYDATILQHGKIVRFGLHHAFRFWDPKVEEKLRRMGAPTGLDGMEAGGPGMEGNGPPAYSPRLQDVLPAGLEFRDEGEEHFLASCITEVAEGMVQYKLAPAYALYLASRYRVDRMRPESQPGEHSDRMAMFALAMANLVREVCEERCMESAQDLAFWMANSSELLHFFKQDRDLQRHTGQAQDLLADTIQVQFRNLVYVMQNDLHLAMPAFLVESDNDDDSGNVLHVLSSAMSLLRRCRVNAALTIQLFSQLFHFVNMWLFNELVRPPPPPQQPGAHPPPCLTTRVWGARLRRRLDRIGQWAERQGLELAADCHLSRIKQAAFLLQAPKSTEADVANLTSACFKLTSVQLRALLEAFQPDGGPGDEAPVPPHLIEGAVAAARDNADALAREEGRPLRVEEDVGLHLPFLLPDDGYSCDSLTGVPPGLHEFLEPLIAEKACRLTPLPSQSNMWTVFMPDHESNHPPPASGGDGEGGPPNEPTLPLEPEIATLILNKVNGSLGLSIVAAKGETQPEKGIYIKSVVQGGAAALEGTLQAGDQLLEVDGQSLIGLAQERAAELMKETGQVVKLKVARQGAMYHGLATLLSPASPLPVPKVGGGGQFEPTDPRSGPFNQQLSNSKSTPMLNNDYTNAYRPPLDQVDDMRSKSTANLEVDSRGGGPAWNQQKPPSARNDYNRAQSQPDLLANVEEQANYQNYGPPQPQQPDGNQKQQRPDQQQQRPVSQFVGGNVYPPATGGGFGGPVGGGPAQRPKSEFMDLSSGGVGVMGGQPIYQNHPERAQGGVYPQNARLGDMREQSGNMQQPQRSPDLPPPPANRGPDHGPPVPPHPQHEELPPPPSSNYVNYESNMVRSQQPASTFPHHSGDPRNMPSPGGPPARPADYSGPQSGPGARDFLQAGSPSSAAYNPQQQPFGKPAVSKQQTSPGYMGNQRGDGGYNQPPPPSGTHHEGAYPHGNAGDSYGRGGPVRDGVRLPGLGSGPGSAGGGAWQKEEEEKRVKLLREEGYNRRDDMIRELQMKPGLNREEEDKLRKLKLDQDFDRRAAQENRPPELEEDWNRASQNGIAPGPIADVPGDGLNQSSGLQSVRNNLERQERQRQGSAPPIGDGLQPNPARNSYYGRPAVSGNGPQPSGQPLVKEVKLNSLPSKTITFKPAYRPDQPAAAPASTAPPMNNTQSAMYRPGPPGSATSSMTDGRMDPANRQPPYPGQQQQPPSAGGPQYPSQGQGPQYPGQRQQQPPGPQYPAQGQQPSGPQYTGQGQRGPGPQYSGQGHQLSPNQPPWLNKSQERDGPPRQQYGQPLQQAPSHQQQQPMPPQDYPPTNQGPAPYADNRPGTGSYSGPPPPERTSSYNVGGPQQQPYRGPPATSNPAPLGGPAPYRPGPAGYQPPGSNAQPYAPVSVPAVSNQPQYPGASTGPSSYQQHPPVGAYVPLSIASSGQPLAAAPAPTSPVYGNQPPSDVSQRRGMFAAEKKSVSFNANVSTELISPGPTGSIPGAPAGAVPSNTSAPRSRFAYEPPNSQPSARHDIVHQHNLGAGNSLGGGVSSGFPPPPASAAPYIGRPGQEGVALPALAGQQQTTAYRPPQQPSSATQPVQMRGASGRSGPPRDFSSQIEGEGDEGIEAAASHERMSFRDKMKLFANTAGESTPPQEKVKSSRTQRKLEDVLIYGNGRM